MTKCLDDEKSRSWFLLCILIGDHYQVGGLGIQLTVDVHFRAHNEGHVHSLPIETENSTDLEKIEVILKLT